MKKIMFNDKFGLTQAVLEGRKTMTRRIITHPLKFKGQNVCGYYVCRKPSGEVTEVCMYDEDERMIDEGQIFSKYQVGEVVSIAQGYGTIFAEMMMGKYDYDLYEKFRQLAMGMKLKGNNNKMFVKADLMIHNIEITEIKVERLQDISEEDCLKEGVYRLDSANGNGDIAYSFVGASDKKHIGLYDTPREAFAVLIDKVSGKGVFQSNPYVFVYEFKLIN